MASINGIKIKELKTFEGRSGTYFQGSFYLGNKKLGFWTQDGNDALLDRFDFERPYSEDKLRRKIEEINKDKAETFHYEDGSSYTKEYTAETLLTDYLILDDNEKEFKKAIEKGASGIAIFTDGLYSVKWNLPPSYTVLTDDQIKALLDPDPNNLRAEDKYVKHEFIVYRSLDDFDIGAPIDINDIMY